MASERISHLVLRKENVKADWKLHVQTKEENNGRRVLVNKIYISKEFSCTRN